MNSKLQKGFFLLLSLIAVFLSLNLLLHYYNVEQSLSLCSTQGGCDAVAKSSYAAIGRIPIALIGYLYFSFLAALLFHSLLSGESLKNFSLLFVLVFSGVVADIVLFVLMVFVIEQFCALCFSTYIINLLLLIFIFAMLSKQKQGQEGFSSFVAHLFKQGVKELMDFFAFHSPMRKINILAWVFLFAFFCGGLWLNWNLSAQKKKSVSALPTLSAEQQKELDFRWQVFLQEYQKAPQVSLTYLQPEGVYNNQKGQEKAILTIVEYSDFLCPYCKVAADYLAQVEQVFGDDVKIVHHSYPLDMDCNSAMQRQMHKGSCLLSQASVCAGEQKSFWGMYHLIFANQNQWQTNGVHEKDVLAMVKVLNENNSANINADAFAACLKKPQSLQTVKQEVQNANALGINSTPTIYFNGRQIGPFLEGYILQKLIAYEKEQQKKKP